MRFPKMTACCGLALAWAMISPAPAAEDFRVFRSSTGQPLKARFEGMEGDVVKLRREDGVLFELPKDRLSQEDQVYVTEAKGRAGSEADALNKAAGHAIVTGESFDLRKAEEMAKGLRLRPESQSKFGRSWRLYAAFVKDYRLFGAMPYSVALYSDEEGLATAVSVVYANKGDFGSKAGFGEDHFSGGGEAEPANLEEAMTLDEERVSKAISSVLGEPVVQRFGEGATRRKIARWDWNGHAFLLSHEPGEYVGLSIVSSGTADAGGKSSRMSDADLKKRLAECVVREENGDVYLTEIPMVDQGPKGYCVPATFERAMRTMGLDADMYLLAMVGQSSAGGGTSVELLLENVRSQVYRKGRRPRDLQLKDLKIRDVKRYLDEGIPVMWVMCSVNAYNKVANGNTEARGKVEDWSAYAAQIAEAAKRISAQPKPDSNYHICMIIGYNEKTNEFAVSDSWGASYEMRWVPVDVAKWVCDGRLFLILP